MGKRIAKKREAKGLDQSELGRLLDITPQAVQSWISQDRIPPKYIPMISDVTGIAKNKFDPIVFQEH